MTTVATDGMAMAADTRMGGETLHGHISKLMLADDGAILGWAGQAFDGRGFLAWYNGGREGVPDVSDDFEGLILQSDGVILNVNEKGRWFIHPSPAVIGSGCCFVLGALDAGATLVEAVEIAIGRDGFSSGTVGMMSIGT